MHFPFPCLFSCSPLKNLSSDQVLMVGMGMNAPHPRTADVAVAHLAGRSLTAEISASKVLDKLCAVVFSLLPLVNASKHSLCFCFPFELQTLPTQSKCYDWVVGGMWRWSRAGGNSSCLPGVSCLVCRTFLFHGSSEGRAQPHCHCCIV